MELDLAELGVGTFCEVVVSSSSSHDIVRGLVPSEVLDGEGLDFGPLADQLLALKTILLTAPELALLEALADRCFLGEVFIFKPFVLDGDRATSLGGNVPAGLRVTLLQHVDPPLGLSPFAASVVATGFSTGADTSLIPSWSAQVMRMWADLWFGRRTLLLPHSGLVRSRPHGWVSVTTSRSFTDVVSVGDARPSDVVADGSAEAS